MRQRLETALPILLVATVSYLPVLGTWWFHDDWVFLADAAGIAPRGDSLVRVVSYQLYWSVFYPLFGLSTWAWGLTRLALHAGSALLVARLGGHGGLDRHARILAGMLFAAAPVAIESLYWGTGAIELLGVFLGLAALERWLAGSVPARWSALALAALAVLSKEAGLLLVVVFAASLVREHRMRTALAPGVLALAALAAWAAWLVTRDFATTTQYAVDIAHAPRNLLVYGQWLVTPVPLLRDSTLLAPAALGGGAVVWGLWGLLAWRHLSRGDRCLAVCLGVTLLAVAPATILGDHAVPRYLYGPSAGLALTVARIAFPGQGPRRASLVLVAALLTVVAWSGTAYVREARVPSGRPTHRLAFKEAISRYSRAQIEAARIGPRDRVLILQSEQTDDLQFELLRATLMDDLAIRLLRGPGVSVTWAKEIRPADTGAVTFTTSGANLVHQGRLRQRE
ncbi:MAG: hypothetical protein IH621_04435 [Krumholzibacteria bacterium]|nr:hypothetical protein [Candidatus Krumholzibacteria bacterium]